MTRKRLRGGAAAAWLLLAAAAALAQEQHGGASPAAGAAAAACRTGYVASASSCACAPGWGSHVPGWPNATYPTLPPTCALFRPGKDKLYKAGTVFPPAGAGKGKCFCFACPPGYTSAGGQLSRADAACKAAPTLSLAATYTIQTSGALCDAKVSAAVGAKLLAALKRATKVDAQLAPASCPDSPAGSTTPARHQLVLRLSYTGTDAQKQLKQFRTVARKINAPPSKTAGPCAFGVCDAVTKASRGAASATAAAAEIASSVVPPGGLPSPKPQSGCQDTGCESRACQTSACETSSGVCSYTNLADGTACSDGVVSGQCKAGTCAGLNTNIEAAAQGVTEPVIFKARFAGGASLGKAVTLNGLRNGSDVGEVLGTLYDDGSRLHEDRFAGDGVFSNVILLTFAESDQPVYKAFYVSLLGAADKSLPVSIAAVTTRIDTLLELFPTEQLVTTAQAKVAELVDGGASPEQAIAAIYDLLIEYSAVGGGGRRRAAAAVVPQGDASVNLTAILSRVDASTVTRTTERRVEFKTLEGFPCMVLAPTEYDRSISGGKCSDAAGARRRLQRSRPQQLLAPVSAAAAAAAGGSAGAGSRGGVGVAAQLELLREAAAASPTASGSGAAGEQEQAEPAPGPAPDYASLARGAVSSWRRLQQAQQCPTSKGEVLVLAPFLLENECSGFGDEAADVAALFKAAGYDVTFKCNDAALCPAGPPALEDFTGWSKYVAVVVSSRGDDDADGNNPVLLTRAPIDLDRYQLDWQAGRIVLSADGHAALRPSWFEKYRNAAGADPARTVVFFASDRSAISPPASARDGVGEKGFAGAFWSMDGAAGYAGFTGYLSRSFDAPSPGVAMAQSLLAGRSVDSYVGTDGKDKLTGAAFRSYPYRRTSTLLDRCAFKCDRVTCSPPQCALSEVICNTLTGSCDISCCNRKDGESCRLRGRPSTCSGGKCVDNCASALCSAPPCQALVGEQGAICDPVAGRCPTTNLPDGTSCSFQGGRGSCVAGACKGLVALYYRLSGPASSFPATLNAAALSAFAAGVAGSLDLPPSYPTSRISVSVLQPPQRAARGLRAAPAQDTTARLSAELLDPPSDTALNFNILVSTAKLQLGDPFGPGLTVQRTDESGNVVDVTTSDSSTKDLCKFITCTPNAPCTTSACAPATGKCEAAPAKDGAACGTNGTCTAGACVVAPAPAADPCANRPCDGLNNAAKGSCASTGDNTTQAASFRCDCDAGFSWTNGACVGPIDRCANVTCASTECKRGSCNVTTGACASANINENGACTTPQGARRARPRPATAGQGVCRAGVCTDLCANVVCAAVDCRTGACSPTNGSCTYTHLGDGTLCSGGGTCFAGACVPPAPNPCAGVSCTASAPCRLPNSGVCSNGACSYTYSAVGASCTLTGGGAGSCVASGGGATVCTDLCANVTCSGPPPSVCRSSSGTCSSGTCDYAPRPTGSGCGVADGSYGTCTAGGACQATVIDRVRITTKVSSGLLNENVTGVYTPLALAVAPGGTIYFTTTTGHVGKVVSTTPSAQPGMYEATVIILASFPDSNSLPGLVVDADEAWVYVADEGMHCVRTVATDGSSSSVALGVCEGYNPPYSCTCAWCYYGPPAGCSGSSMPATGARLNAPQSVALGAPPVNGSSPTLLVADSGNGCVRELDLGPGGYVVAVFGTCSPANIQRPRVGSAVLPGSGFAWWVTDNFDGTVTYIQGASNTTANLRGFTETGNLSYVTPSNAALDLDASALHPTSGALVFGSDYVDYDTSIRSHSLLVVPSVTSLSSAYMAVPFDGGAATGGPLDPVLTRVGKGGLAFANGVLWVADGGRDNAAPGQFTRLSLDALPAVPAYFSRVFAGARHTCGVTRLGSGSGPGAPTCWGAGGAALTPPSITLGSGTPSGFAGGFHTCLQDGVGAYRCWGDNSTGQLAPPPGLNSAAYVLETAAGRWHSCALYADANYTRRLECWGCEPGNPLCDFVANNVTVDGLPGSSPAAGTAVADFGGIFSGPSYLCVQTVVVNASIGRSLQCFDGTGVDCGEKCNHPLGLSLAPGNRGVAGLNHTCMTGEADYVRCWPSGVPAAVVPVEVASRRVIDLCAGDDFTCALFDAGGWSDTELRCWPPSVLTLPPGLGESVNANVTSIACGASHVCATRDNGATVCVGTTATSSNGCAWGACNVPVADRGVWPFRP
ncbi:hypothetical protein HT031_004572 [Scenedesmus sp. PABB004]|nr:hypothetical protein HT031_004572 [Scenedesmus sp. PABB004]